MPLEKSSSGGARALGAALAMVGSGAWSVDAPLFERKLTQMPQR